MLSVNPVSNNIKNNNLSFKSSIVNTKALSEGIRTAHERCCKTAYNLDEIAEVSKFIEIFQKLADDGKNSTIKMYSKNNPKPGKASTHFMIVENGEDSVQYITSRLNKATDGDEAISKLIQFGEDFLGIKSVKNGETITGSSNYRYLDANLSNIEKSENPGIQLSKYKDALLGSLERISTYFQM